MQSLRTVPVVGAKWAKDTAQAIITAATETESDRGGGHVTRLIVLAAAVFVITRCCTPACSPPTRQSCGGLVTFIGRSRHNSVGAICQKPPRLT